MRQQERDATWRLPFEQEGERINYAEQGRSTALPSSSSGTIQVGRRVGNARPGVSRRTRSVDRPADPPARIHGESGEPTEERARPAHRATTRTARPDVEDDIMGAPTSVDTRPAPTPLVSARAVPDEEEDVVEAKKDNFVTLVKENRRVQIPVGLLVLLVVGMAVGLGVALSGGSSSSSSNEDESAFYTEVGRIDGIIAEGEFGTAVSMSGDGRRLAVGAPGVPNSALSRSFVQVYERNDETGAWKDIGSFNVGEQSSGDRSLAVRSSLALALSHDGKTLAIGAPFHDNANSTKTNVGLVEVHSSVSGQWQQLGETLYGRNAGDIFGASVSVSEDGAIVAVGAPGSEATNSTGYAQVMQLNKGSWISRGSDIVGKVAGGMFGGSVSLSGDGKMLAVGASTAPGNEVVVRMYKFFDDWNEQGTGIQGREGLRNTAFLAKLSSNGNIVVISNYYIDSVTPGSDKAQSNESLDVRTFQFNGDEWVPLGENLHANIDGFKSGYIVTLSDDGFTIGMGDPGTQGAGGGADTSGHAHIYKYQDNAWKQIGPNILGMNAGDQFGFSVSISGDGRRFVTGAPFNRGNGFEHGRVQVFEYDL